MPTEHLSWSQTWAFKLRATLNHHQGPDDKKFQSSIVKVQSLKHQTPGKNIKEACVPNRPNPEVD